MGNLANDPHSFHGFYLHFLRGFVNGGIGERLLPTTGKVLRYRRAVRAEQAPTA